ncbi:MAG: hypothetical protein LBC99_08265 [Spirochaetota bacterium]|jgi:hypothetical protein|nr:hypothetical protein [Spirochaetota bacterium]
MPDTQPSRLHRLFYKPIFYRARSLDIFLPTLFGVSVLGILYRALLAKQDVLPVTLAFSLLLILVMNRFAWLLSGRGKILPARIRTALSILLTDAPAHHPQGEFRFSLISFCVRARIPWGECIRALDRVMADTGLTGYLHYGTLELVRTDQPLANKRCAVCDTILADSMVVERSCGVCGTWYYI